MYDKTGRESLGRLATQINDLVERADREGRKDFTSAEREQYHRLEAAFSKQEELVVAREGRGSDVNGAAISDFLEGARPGRNAISEFPVESIRAAFRGGRRREADPYSEAFSAYLREGSEGLSAEQRDIMRANFRQEAGKIMNAQTTSTSGGGYLIPAGFSYMLEEAMKFYGGIDGLVGEFKTADGRPWPWPTLNDVANVGRIIAENTQVVETDMVFGQITFNAYIASSDVVLIPLTLVEDSAFNLDALIAKLLGIRLGRLRGQYATVGTGTAQPTGVVNACVAAGLIYTCPNGSTTSVAYSDLVNLEHTVDPIYRQTPSTRFLFSDTMLKRLKLLVDGNNRPLWLPSLSGFQDGAGVQLPGLARPTILGHEYSVNPQMAVPAANAATILFGCLDCFKVRKLESGINLLVLKERYADYYQRGYVAFERWDSNLIDAGTHPIAVLKQSAS